MSAIPAQNDEDFAEVFCPQPEHKCQGWQRRAADTNAIGPQNKNRFGKWPYIRELFLQICNPIFISWLYLFTCAIKYLLFLHFLLLSARLEAFIFFSGASPFSKKCVFYSRNEKYFSIIAFINCNIGPRRG